MGKIFSKMWAKVFTNIKINIIIIGLDNAGKTTILYESRFGEVLLQIINFSYYETVENSKLSLICWNVGECDRNHPYFKPFYETTQGIIFVVDSNDRDRIDQAYYELETILKEDQLNDAVLLVFANKQDLHEAMRVDEITEKLQLFNIKNRIWHVQGLCACSGDGLYEGFEWLSDTIHKKLKAKT